MFSQTQIGTLLHEEHLHTIHALQRFQDFLTGQTAKRPPDLARPEVGKVLDGVLRSVAAEVDRHFAFEETQLFPLLSEQGEVGIVHMLTEEHAVIRPLVLELAKDAVAALNGTNFTAESWKDFHARGMELCEREVFHIQKEEMGLLAAIAALVDPDDDGRLAALYRSLVVVS